MPLNVHSFPDDTGALNRWAVDIERRLQDIHQLGRRGNATAVQAQQAAQVSTNAAVVAPVVQSFSVSQGSYSQDGSVFAKLTVSYVAPKILGTFAGVGIAVVGYHGSTVPYLVADDSYSGVSGGAQSFSFSLDRTGESVTFYCVSRNTSGTYRTPWTSAPSQVLTLNAALSTLPAPTGLTASYPASGAGVQLTWTNETASNLAGYKIYRNTADSFAGATNIASFGVPRSGNPSYLDATGAAATVYYYFITAVDTASTESPASGGVQAVSSGSAGQGSPVTINGCAITYNASWPSPGNPQITYAMASGTAYWPDGTQLTIPAIASTVVTTWTGITIVGNTEYSANFVYNLLTGVSTVQQLIGAPTPAFKAQALANGLLGISIGNNVTTPAAQGGSTTGQGGGGATCPADDQLMEALTPDGADVVVPAATIAAGWSVRDWNGTWNKVYAAWSVEGELHYVSVQVANRREQVHVDLNHKWAIVSDPQGDKDDDWITSRTLQLFDRLVASDGSLAQVIEVSRPHRGRYRKIKCHRQRMRIGALIGHNIFTS